ncbi:hypothetical protein D2C72_08015 (plasmid) [Helicobacter pylori]|nr:hypothetical protein D2C72_08015 [Helicobacter pylori]
MFQKTLHLSLARHYTYHWQDTTPSLARHYTYHWQDTTPIIGKKFCFIHFHPKMRNHTASLFRGLQPPIPHARARARMLKHVKTT